MSENNWIAGAAEALAGGAFAETDTSPDAPRRKIGKAIVPAQPSPDAPAAEPLTDTRKAA